MAGLLSVSSVIIAAFIGLQDPSDPGMFYSSGLYCGDNSCNISYYKPSDYPIIRIPFKFKTNSYYKPIESGLYQVRPVLKDSVPVMFDLVKLGQVAGTVTIQEYHKLNYIKKEATADLAWINNHKAAQIKIIYGSYEIYGLIESAE